MHPLFHPLFVNYCTYFNGNQDYFECHEVLEEYWKEVAPGEKKHPLVGYVQLATGMYHWRRNNRNGAIRILKKAYENFIDNKNSLYFELIDYQDLCKQCINSISAIEENMPFQPFQLIVLDDSLKQLVEKEIIELPTFEDNYLVHKHMLRDRSDILLAREMKIKSNKLK